MSPRETINITDTLTLLTAHIIEETDIFSHIDLDSCLVCISSNRKNSRGAIYGKVVPLKFKNGSSTVTYRGNLYHMPRVEHRGKELLYLIYYYMPRFFDLSAREKCNVIFHELYHISPWFNGDIRRMGKKKAAHGHSKKHFDTHYEKQLEDYMHMVENTPFIKFLNLTSRDLYRHFNVVGRRMKIPKPVKSGSGNRAGIMFHD